MSKLKFGLETSNRTYRRWYTNSTINHFNQHQGVSNIGNSKKFSIWNSNLYLNIYIYICWHWFIYLRPIDGGQPNIGGDPNYKIYCNKLFKKEWPTQWSTTHREELLSLSLPYRSIGFVFIARNDCEELASKPILKKDPTIHYIITQITIQIYF